MVALWNFADKIVAFQKHLHEHNSKHCTMEKRLDLTSGAEDAIGTLRSLQRCRYTDICNDKCHCKVTDVCSLYFQYYLILQGDYFSLDRVSSAWEWPAVVTAVHPETSIPISVMTMIQAMTKRTTLRFSCALKSHLVPLYRTQCWSFET